MEKREGALAPKVWAGCAPEMWLPQSLLTGNVPGAYYGNRTR